MHSPPFLGVFSRVPKTPKFIYLWAPHIILMPTGEASNVNPRAVLIRAVTEAEHRVAEYKHKVREFYFQVMLSPYACQACGGRLQMSGRSKCSCEVCGLELDPTLAFQQSTCCGCKLLRHPMHYCCSRCKAVVPSRFLFDERVFDKSYFKEMMRSFRERARAKKEAVRAMLANSRSGELCMAIDPDPATLPDLMEALDDVPWIGRPDYGFLEAGEFFLPHGNVPGTHLIQPRVGRDAV